MIHPKFCDIPAIMLAVGALCSSAYAAPGFAAPVSQSPAGTMFAFQHDPAHAAAVASVATATFNTSWGCATSSAAPAALAKVYPAFGPVRFNGVTLTSGVITEQVVVTGCGLTKVENVLTAALQGKPARVLSGIPGTTLADPTLAHDTMGFAAPVVRALAKGCTNAHFIDASFDTFTGPPNPKAKFQNHQGQPWQETWLADICGQKTPLTVHYIPDESGTRIVVGPSRAR